MALDFPANPVDGQVFDAYTWNASKGVWQAREESAAVTVVSPTAPSLATNGDLWFNSNLGVLFAYYDDGSTGQWVEVITTNIIDISGKANLAGGNTFSGTQTFSTPIAVGSGGTGATSLTSGAYLKGNGSNTIQTQAVPIPISDGGTNAITVAGAQSNLQIQTSPNYVINGAFDIWQRSVGPVAGSGYTSADRWYVYNGGTNTTTVARETSIVPTGFYASCKITQTSATSSYIGLFQSIETLNTVYLAGKTVTVSAYVYGTVSTEFRVSLQASTSVDLTPATGFSATVATQSQTVGATWTRITASGTVPSNTKTLRVDISAVNPTLSQPFYFTGLQVEEGLSATTFRRNTPTVQTELAACQRYYFNNGIGGGYYDAFMNFSTDNYRRLNIHFPVPLRRVPTLSDVSITWNTGTPSADSFSPLSMRAYSNVGGAGTGGWVTAYSVNVEL